MKNVDFECDLFAPKASPSPSPLSASKPEVEYASKPSSVIRSHYQATEPINSPCFANLIHLKTLDSNLYLGFGFAIDAIQNTDRISDTVNSTIILGPDTAKQLFFSLAELFDCDISPKP